jgi:hypothetical protein
MLISVVFLFLIFFARIAFPGAIQQWDRSITVLQKCETSIQLVSSPLSLFVIITVFVCRELAKGVRIIWAICFVTTAVLSSFCWGPIMALPITVFSILSVVIAFFVVYYLNHFNNA